MSFTEAKNWFGLIQQAPEWIRKYLECIFWALIFLVLVWAILKILFNKQFKEFYRVIAICIKKAGELGRVIAKEAAKNLELPEPYPRVAKFFAIVSMVVEYVISILFSCFFLIFVIAQALSPAMSFGQKTVALLFTLLIGYLAWFFFAQAERDRVKLFKATLDKER